MLRGYSEQARRMIHVEAVLLILIALTLALGFLALLRCDEHDHESAPPQQCSRWEQIELPPGDDRVILECARTW